MSDIETLSILSPLQEGLLFRELYTKGAGGEYIVQTVIHLHGKIDSEAVQIAWEKWMQEPNKTVPKLWRVGDPI